MLLPWLACRHDFKPTACTPSSAACLCVCVCVWEGKLAGRPVWFVVCNMRRCCAAALSKNHVASSGLVVSGEVSVEVKKEQEHAGVASYQLQKRGGKSFSLSKYDHKVFFIFFLD